MEAELHRASQTGPDFGWTLEAGPPAWAGWPFAAALELSPVTVAGSALAVPGRAAWTAERLRLSLAVTDPTSLAVVIKGRQAIEVAGLPPRPFHTRQFRVSVPLKGDEPVTLLAADIDAETPSGVVRVGALRLALMGSAATIAAEAIAVPGELGRALGPNLEQVRGRVALSRPIPAASSPAAAATAWRDAGGTLEATDLALRWGELAVTGQATMRLDERLQPALDGTLRASGLAPAIDGLARAGVMPARSAMAAKAVLSLLTAPAPERPVELPVQLGGGILALARFPLIRLAELDWGPK